MVTTWMLRLGLALELLGGALLAVDVFADPIQDWIEAVARASLKTAQTALLYLLFVLILLYGVLEELLVAVMRPILVVDSETVLTSLTDLQVVAAWVKVLQSTTPIGADVFEILGVVGICLSLAWTLNRFLFNVDSELRKAFDYVPVEEFMIDLHEREAVTPGLPAVDVITKMVDDRRTAYPVVENESVVGLITLEAVKAIPETDLPDTTVGDVMTTDLATVAADASAVDAVATMQEHDTGNLFVLNEANEAIVGTLTREDLLESFEDNLRGSEYRSDDGLGRIERLRSRVSRWLSGLNTTRLFVGSVGLVAIIGLPLILTWVVPAVTVASLLAALWVVSTGPVLVGYRLESGEWVTSGLRIAGVFFLTVGFFIQLIWTFLS